MEVDLTEIDTTETAVTSKSNTRFSRYSQTFCLRVAAGPDWPSYPKAHIWHYSVFESFEDDAARE